MQYAQRVRVVLSILSSSQELCLKEGNNCTICLFFFVTSTLEGYYVDDALQGQGLYTYEDGGVLHGTHVDGELNGPAQEYDIDGRLIFKGQYKDDNRHGVCWIYYPVSLISCFLCWRIKEGHRSRIG